MGYYTAFLIKRTQLKKEMKAFIKSKAGSENTQKLVLSMDQYTTSIDFIEENEFIYNGHLYDLVNKETSENRMILYCISDEKEEMLMETANEYFCQNHDQNSSSNKQNNILKHIIKDYLSFQVIKTFKSAYIKLFFKPYSVSFLDVNIIPSSPPPKTYC